MNQILAAIFALLFLVCTTDCIAQGLNPPSPAAPTGLRIRSDFPGGSALVRSVDEATRTIRISPAGHVDRGFVCWWYFKLEGVEVGSTVTIEISASGWGRPDRAQFSYDNRVWDQTEAGELKARDLTVYRHQAKATEVWFAWGPPFLLKHANELMNKAKLVSPYVTTFELAKSREGRSVPALRIFQPGVVDQERFGVWVAARQHAWESGSSWVGQGFVEWLISKDPAAEALRKRVEIYFVPIVDVDSVEAGVGGKNQKPHDHYWDWRAEPIYPETRAAIERISALEAAGRFDLYVDLHNPGAQNKNILFYTPAKPLLIPARLENQNAFLKLALEEMTGAMGFKGELGPAGETYDPAVDPAGDCWIANHCRPHVVSLVLETPWNTSSSTQSGYMTTGEQLGRTMERYLRGKVRP